MKVWKSVLKILSFTLWALERHWGFWSGTWHSTAVLQHLWGDRFRDIPWTPKSMHAQVPYIKWPLVSVGPTSPQIQRGGLIVIGSSVIEWIRGEGKGKMEKDTAGVQAEVMKTLARVRTDETKREKDLRANLNLFTLSQHPWEVRQIPLINIDSLYIQNFVINAAENSIKRLNH